MTTATAMAAVIVIVVFVVGWLTNPMTDIELAFPDGRQVTVRLPRQIAEETTSRSLSFTVQRGPVFQVRIIVSDSPVGSEEARAGEVVTVDGAVTGWRFLPGESGLQDRLIFSTDNWTLHLGRPGGVEDLAQLAQIVELSEEDGVPVIDLSSGTSLTGPPPGNPRGWLVYAPRWFYDSPRGEWAVTVVPSCDGLTDATESTIQPLVQSCDQAHRVYLSASGEPEFMARIDESFEIVSRPPG